MVVGHLIFCLWLLISFKNLKISNHLCLLDIWLPWGLPSVYRRRSRIISTLQGWHCALQKRKIQIQKEDGTIKVGSETTASRRKDKFSGKLEYVSCVFIYKFT